MNGGLSRTMGNFISIDTHLYINISILSFGVQIHFRMTALILIFFCIGMRIKPVTTSILFPICMGSIVKPYF